MSSRTTAFDSRIAPGSTPKPRFLDTLARRALQSRLGNLRHGEIILHDGNEEFRFGQVTTQCALSVSIQVRHPGFYSDIAFGGSIGAGEAYMADYWSCSDLTALVRILLCNREVLDGMEGGLASLTAPIQKALHWFNRNSQIGSRRNIAAHYDLDNLTAIIDRNNLQITGKTEDVCDIEPLEAKCKAFGWRVEIVDGHDIAAMTDVLRAIPFEAGKPSMIIANTTKGTGISFIENDYKWHHRVPDDKQYRQAQRELDALLGEIES